MEPRLRPTNSLFTCPFNPFIIYNRITREVIFYSQAYAYQAGISPSTLSPSFKKVKNAVSDDYLIPYSTNYKIYTPIPKKPIHLFEENLEKCIHELRTSSHIINLGYGVVETLHSYDRIIYSALQRQELSTIIASDLLYLLGISKNIQPVSLSVTINEAIRYATNDQKMSLYTFNNLLHDFHSFSSPLVWGDRQFLTNFFRTILHWIKIPIFIELVVKDPVTVLVSFITDTDLSQNISYKMVIDYIYYVASYFNYRSWIDQKNIHFLMPTTKAE